MSGVELLPALLAAAATLLVAGVAKLHDPAPAAAALDALGFPAPRTVVRLAAAAELSVGGAVVARPSAAADAALAALYLAFAALVALQLRRGIVLSCGCLGAAEIPPSPFHLLLNTAVTGLAAAAALRPPTGLPDLIAAHPAAGILVAAAALAAARLVLTALVLLPPLLASYRPPAA